MTFCTLSSFDRKSLLNFFNSSVVSFRRASAASLYANFSPLEKPPAPASVARIKKGAESGSSIISAMPIAALPTSDISKAILETVTADTPTKPAASPTKGMTSKTIERMPRISSYAYAVSINLACLGFPK